MEQEQLYLFAKQHHKQLIVAKNGYEFAVTDSPLQLCSFYASEDEASTFSPFVDTVFDSFENINFFLTRNTKDTFEERGRLQTREQADLLEDHMREFLAKKNISYIDVPVDMLTPWRILEAIKPGLACWPTFEKTSK